MSKEQKPQAEKLPSILTVDIRILGLGHFQGRNGMVTIYQSCKALLIRPNSGPGIPASGAWVSAEECKSYQMDFRHGLLYMVLNDNTDVVQLAEILEKSICSEDLMDSSTKLRGPALRIWLAEDVNLTMVEQALDSLGILCEDQDLAKDMFTGTKITPRQKQNIPLRKGIKRSRSPDNPSSERHAQLLLQRVTTLYESGSTADCKLISRDAKEFPAHRAILAAWSPVFTNMFSTDMMEKASGVCRIKNFDGDVVNVLLSYLYTGMLPDIEQSVENVLDIADQYDIPGLRVACEEKLTANITSKNAPRYLYLADLRGLGSLKAKAAEFVAEHVSDFSLLKGSY